MDNKDLLIGVTTPIGSRHCGPTAVTHHINFLWLLNNYQLIEPITVGFRN